MNITEEDILKVFQDSDDEEISFNGVGEEKDQSLFDKIEPTDFLQISMVKHEINEKPEGSTGDSRSRSNHKSDKKFQKTFQNRCRQFICEICGKGFHKLPTLRAHKNLHWLESYVERQDQKIEIPTRDNFSRSKTKPSPSSSFEDGKTNTEIMMKEVDKYLLKTYTCLECEKQIQYLERSGAIVKTLKLNPVNKPFSCKFCGKKFLQIRQMDY